MPQHWLLDPYQQSFIYLLAPRSPWAAHVGSASTAFLARFCCHPAYGNGLSGPLPADPDGRGLRVCAGLEQPYESLIGGYGPRYIPTTSGLADGKVWEAMHRTYIQVHLPFQPLLS